MIHYIWRLSRSSLRWLLLSVTTMFFAVIGACSVIAWQVYFGDESSLKKSTIMAKIKEETTIFYLDEKTPIGSIFESRHRRYIPIEEIPEVMLQSIVAVEDKSFYSHVGIDPISITKAAIEGILAGGRFRRGGSTITQQTVKNIIDDWEQSFTRKFREMIKALQLERMYSKKQILEFYLNQFHVAGNGNGIGIAARYYFDKEVQELNLVESAFIAGSVKGPSKYNPFIKYTKQARAEAKAFAEDRKNYVIKQMFEQNMITEQQYKEAITTQVPFNRGEFRTAEVALVELIKAQLQQKEILEALNIKAIEDLNVAGLRVFTTIDAQFQEAAQLAMRKNLSRLETILGQFGPEASNQMTPMRYLDENSFVYGRIEEIHGKTIEDYNIKLSFGIPSGHIPNESLMRYAMLLDIPDGRGWKYHFKQIMDTLKVGDVLFTQVISYDKNTNEAVCELQKRPIISGGMVALDKGEVRAVVSGFDTLGFNRAIYAKRQPGSVFKSLVYFAGLQMGWSMLDEIDNGRQIFPYQGRFYFPRPDHPTPYEKTSMLWAGVMSENLASVALGEKLTEKLTFEDFRKILASVDLMPYPQEAPRDFHYRISKATGVSLDVPGHKAFHLRQSIDALAADLIFNGEGYILEDLRRMWWGQGYVGEARFQVSSKDAKISKSEVQTRVKLLENNFERYKRLSASLQEDWKILEEGTSASNLSSAAREAAKNFRVLPSKGHKPELGYFRNYPEETYAAGENSDFFLVQGRPLNQLDIQAIWGDGGILGESSKAGISFSDVRLSGLLTVSVFQQLEEILNERYRHYEEQLAQSSDSYQLLSYYNHYDFRVGIGLHYLVELAKQTGVYSHLEPVLSFPLGSNDVTATEIGKIYQTFISGKVYRFYKDGLANQVNFIRRIEDRFGNVLFEPKVQDHQLVRPEVASQMREILSKIVTHGTGRRARGELFITNPAGPSLATLISSSKDKEKKQEATIRIPAYGKTGTTNDFQTSYFAGFLPYPVAEKQPLDPENSYVIAAYVGYDMNKSMTKGRYTNYGGSGALPLWIDFAKEIIKIRQYDTYVDPKDPYILAHKEWPVKHAPQMSSLLVDLPRGLVLRLGGQTDNDTWNTTDISHTGETYQDLYALGTVTSVIRVPSHGQSLSQTLRLVSPFSKKLSDQAPFSVSPAESAISAKDAQSPATEEPEESDPSSEEKMNPLKEEGIIDISHQESKNKIW